MSSFKSFWFVLIVTVVAVGTAYCLSIKQIDKKVSEVQSKDPQNLQKGNDSKTKTISSELITADSAPFNMISYLYPDDTKESNPKYYALKKDSQFGFINNLEIDDRTQKATISYDQAFWHLGNEAEAIARRDLKCGTSKASPECKEDTVLIEPYHIEDHLVKEIKYTLSPDIEIKLIDYETTGLLRVKIVTVNDLFKYLEERDPHNPDGSGDVPFWIVIKNGVVTYIEEQALP